MPLQDTQLADLRQALEGVPSGALSKELVKTIEQLLSVVWDKLDGGRDTGMAAHKLRNRCQAMAWEPPVLSFEIERHGGTVLGSGNAEVQSWDVDLSEATAKVNPSGKRVLHRNKTIDVGDLAKVVSELVVSGSKHEWLQWISPSAVSILISKIVPQTNKQTTASRRKRFIKSLTTILSQKGWTKKPNSSKHVFLRA